MGQTVCAAVEGAEDMELTGRADPSLGTSLADVLGDADVVVDFTTPDTALANARECLEAGVHCVIGTTGADLTELEGVGSANLFFAPNFAIGAVLMMEAAKLVAPHMPECEIIELHHPAKLDAPSGTAIRTAELIEEAGRKRARADPLGAPARAWWPARRCVFGGEGQTLSIRHDTISRESFMPGVLLAVRRVGQLDQQLVDRPGDAALGRDLAERLMPSSRMCAPPADTRVEDSLWPPSTNSAASTPAVGPAGGALAAGRSGRGRRRPQGRARGRRGPERRPAVPGAGSSPTARSTPREQLEQAEALAAGRPGRRA